MLGCPLCPCGKSLLLQVREVWQAPCKGWGEKVGGGSSLALPSRPLGQSRSVSRWTTSTGSPPSSLSAAPVTPAQHFGVGTQEPDVPASLGQASSEQGASDRLPVPWLRVRAVRVLPMRRQTLVGQRAVLTEQRHRPLHWPLEGTGLNPSTLGA